MFYFDIPTPSYFFITKYDFARFSYTQLCLFAHICVYVHTFVCTTMWKHTPSLNWLVYKGWVDFLNPFPPKQKEPFWLVVSRIFIIIIHPYVWLYTHLCVHTHKINTHTNLATYCLLSKDCVAQYRILFVPILFVRY